MVFKKSDPGNIYATDEYQSRELHRSEYFRSDRNSVTNLFKNLFYRVFFDIWKMPVLKGYSVVYGAQRAYARKNRDIKLLSENWLG